MKLIDLVRFSDEEVIQNLEIEHNEIGVPVKVLFDGIVVSEDVRLMKNDFTPKKEDNEKGFEDFGPGKNLDLGIAPVFSVGYDRYFSYVPMLGFLPLKRTGAAFMSFATKKDMFSFVPEGFDFFAKTEPRKYKSSISFFPATAEQLSDYFCFKIKQKLEREITVWGKNTVSNN